jgi:hypothetical protein
MLYISTNWKTSLHYIKSCHWKDFIKTITFKKGQISINEINRGFSRVKMCKTTGTNLRVDVGDVSIPLPNLLLSEALIYFNLQYSL